MYNYLEIRDFENGQVVKRFDITGKSDREAQRLADGIGINLNHEAYCLCEQDYTTAQPFL